MPLWKILFILLLKQTTIESSLVLELVEELIICHQAGHVTYGPLRLARHWSPRGLEQV